MLVTTDSGPPRVADLPATGSWGPVQGSSCSFPWGQWGTFRSEIYRVPPVPLCPVPPQALRGRPITPHYGSVGETEARDRELLAEPGESRPQPAFAKEAGSLTPGLRNMTPTGYQNCLTPSAHPVGRVELTLSQEHGVPSALTAPGLWQSELSLPTGNPA